jgi:streptomycin 6-kinase
MSDKVIKIDVPEEFSEGLVNRFGKKAEVWLESVPGLLSDRLGAWGLVIEDEQILHGAMGLIFFVKKGEEKLVLKISWLDDLTESENKALRIWSGNGAVKLLEYDAKTHASLMERLGNQSLNDIDIATAGVEAGRLIKKLGVGVQEGFPRLDARLKVIESYLAKRRLEVGDSGFDWELIKELILRRGKDMRNLLTHGDIGYLNILRANDGSWKAIDPKPMIGDLEFSVPELMWDRIDELRDANVVEHLERIVEAGCLDRQKAIEWTIIRAVDYYYWGIENGLDIDPPRCLRLYKILEGEII